MHRGGSAGEDDVDVQAGKLSRQLGKTLLSPARVALLQGDILTFYIPELSQSLTERRKIGCVGGRAAESQVADPLEPRGLRWWAEGDPAAVEQAETGHSRD